MNTWLANATAGIIAGVTAALILWGVAELRDWQKRDLQLQYIRQTIERGQHKIHDMAIKKKPDKPPRYVSEKNPQQYHRYQLAIFNRMATDLFKSINGQHSWITDYERVEVARIFEPYRLLRKNEVPSKEYYEDLFDGLNKLQWLKE